MKEHYKEERSKFTALENHFLNTYFSGLFLSHGDLLMIANELGISLSMNSREILIKELFNICDQKSLLPKLMSALTYLIDGRIEEYHRLSLSYPHSHSALVRLAQKANGTKNLIARESRSNPYE
ncbi:MAG: hypothetical protein JXK05_04945 [Campylobacterales bacterium]|nr:hypothetical protein [Campylobacterales bacterium]